jgi:hypothetical protein
MKRLGFIFILLSLILAQCEKEDSIERDTVAPAEVTDYNVELLDLDISVTWVNPPDEDLRGIHVILLNEQEVIISEKWLTRDSTSFIFKNVVTGDYSVSIETMDKNGNVSDGVSTDYFYFKSEAAINIANVQYEVKYNTVRMSWSPVDSEADIETIYIKWGDNTVEVSPTDTSYVVTELPDGDNTISYYTRTSRGNYSSISESPALTINFPFVRVEGNGHDFYMALYETTSLEFDTFLNERGVLGDGIYDGKTLIINEGWWAVFDEPTSTWSHGWGEEAPAIYITWNGAETYCEEVWGGRLPTQAEWLYAAQGGPQSAGYAYAGSNTIGEVAQYQYVDGTKIFPVGQLQPNELGIYDMSGNASEYIQELSGTNVQSMGGCTNPTYDETVPLTDPGNVKTWSFDVEGANYFTGFRVLIETSVVHGE